METLLKQKETIHSILDYLKEHGHKSKVIVVHPNTYAKYIKGHFSQQHDEIHFSEVNINSENYIGYLYYNDEWQIKVKLSTMVPVNDFYIVKK